MVFEDCPNHVFENSKLHASTANLGVDVKINHLKEHELIELTKASKDYKKFNSVVR